MQAAFRALQQQRSEEQTSVYKQKTNARTVGYSQEEIPLTVITNEA